MPRERGRSLGSIAEIVAGAGGTLKAAQEMFEVFGPRHEEFLLDPIWWNGISRLANEVGIHPFILLSACIIASTGLMLDGMRRGSEQASKNTPPSAGSDIDPASLNTTIQTMQSIIQNSSDNSQNSPPQS